MFKKILKESHLKTTVNCVKTDESQTCSPETNNTLYVNKKILKKHSKVEIIL